MSQDAQIANNTPHSPLPILVVPAYEPGRGGGHLIRCMALVNGLRELGSDAWLFLPANEAHTDGLLSAAHFDRSRIINETGLSNIQWECVVLDRFKTPPEELTRWSKLSPVIGIDEGGVSRNCFDFLIDILPGCHRVKANIADPSLLPLPEKPVSRSPHTEDTEARRTQREFKISMSAGHIKVLISFGQEDAAGLGAAAAKALAEQNFGTVDITLLCGGLRKPSQTSTPHLKIISTMPNLVNHLIDYDLIITHYGITAFEALYMGVPVVLVSPGGYHEKLARKAGFYSLGVGKSKTKKLKRLLFNKGELNHLFLRKLQDRCAALAVKHNLDHAPERSLAALINGVTPDVSRNCTACGAALNVPAIARYAERSYHRCARCGIIAMNRLTPPPIAYGKEYFFELYQKQYGKTYIEDFPNLTAMAKRRLAVIKSLNNRFLRNLTTNQHEPTQTTGKYRNTSSCGSWLINSGTADNSTPRLLDIGCAYGPFLAAAQEEGFSPCGIDPAEDAVRYVTETLGIPAVQGFFPSMGNGECCSDYRGTTRKHDHSPNNNPTPYSLLPIPYSVVSLWYVIEHFRDCVAVLAEIRKLLKPGGVLAFATPSFTGISGRASLKNFLERSPADHWTIWSPSVCKRVLKTAGFKVKKIVISGHHPERFPVLGKYARSRKSPLYGLLLAVSRIFSLGDTFEVYAAREEAPSL